MKKKKVIACILAAMTTLAIASMSAGCAVKDKFKEWFNEDSSMSSSTILEDNEEESSTSDGEEESSTSDTVLESPTA